MLPHSAVSHLLDGIVAADTVPGWSPLGITIKLPIGLQEIKNLSPGILLVGVVMVVALGLAWMYVKTKGGGSG